VKSYNHCKSSVKLFGGEEDDYLPIHQWFDESKEHFADIRHRALRHHSQGIAECEKQFGVYIYNSDGKKVITKSIAEQHVREDIGFIPSVEDWLELIKPQPWMASTKRNIKMNLM
tara:strand:+ start:666 stop:1010 length:345 start_codon:yes stop_codon:yes gene_type:complete